MDVLDPRGTLHTPVKLRKGSTAGTVAADHGLDGGTVKADGVALHPDAVVPPGTRLAEIVGYVEPTDPAED